MHNMQKNQSVGNWLHIKWSFSLKTFSVEMTKPAGNCEFGHIDWRNIWRKTSYFVQWYQLVGIGRTLKLFPTIVMSKLQMLWLKRFCLYRFLHITIDFVIYFLKSLHDLLIYVKCVICQNFQSASRSIINIFVFKPTFLCYHL